ncbi:MAG TPA: hypothetical protein VJ783_01420 [Pirellulales bacterium]|nr:hypothetical protein [Pirellulales bacterium]
MAKTAGRTTERSSPDFKRDGDVAYVACSAEPGMFKDELLIFIEGVDPERPDKPLVAQVLVDADLVRSVHGTPQRGRPVACALKVGLVRITGGVATIVLPQSGIPVGESMLVKTDLLTR